MSVLVLDVNVLVAAFRSDHPHHDRIMPWWTRTLDHAARFTVPDTVWVGFVRIVTNRRIFPVPALMNEALPFVEAVCAQPGYTPLPHDPELIGSWMRLCAESDVAGDLTPDAYIAAVAHRIGGTVVTHDRDFRRFDGLRTLDPIP